MQLLLRILAPGTPPLDVEVDIDAAQPVARLAAALDEFLAAERGTPRSATDDPPRLLLVRTAEVVDPDATVGTSGIVSGDELAVGDLGATAVPAPALIRGVSLDVLAGPDAGHSAVLDRGSYLIGRDGDCDLALSDLTVSRRHLRVDVALDWTVTVSAENDVENGVLVNDAPAHGAIAVTGDDVVTLGATRIAFRDFIRAADEVRDRLGQIEFHRTPYRPERVRAREFPALGPIPTAGEPRRFQILSAVAPLAAGLAMFAFSGQAQFLVLTLLSPVAIVANFFEDRKSNRRRHDRQVRRFHQRLDERRADVARALYEARVERVRSAPDLADLARRAELRTIDLWPRGRDDGDFLTMRLGLGDADSLVRSPIETTGDDDLRDLAATALAGHERLSDVPVTVSLRDVGTLGLHGDPQRVDDVAASIAVQASCLHSPEDLVIAGAVGDERGFGGWLKWLPHVRSVTSPLGGRHLTTSQDGARELLSELVDVVEQRGASNGHDRGQDRRWPWVLVFLDGDLEPDATLVSQLLDRAGDGGVSVVWLSTSESRVPHQANAVLDCQLSTAGDDASFWTTDPDVPPRAIEVGRVHPEVADRVARCLAPLRDATVATATTAIPRSVPLLSVLGVDAPDGRWIAERWLTNRPYGLEHPVGLGADGVFTLDLVADGPHALIGGTSGAGKSELLQSMVASLISLHPPTRLNFLFVDYKGGASSTAFRGVPHTVGYVTNLDVDLAMRALTSLRAELNRRMRLLEGRAKDLEEMLAKHPEEAPPSLVIVVDEFATLVKEIPDFVTGIVDIAQRGRSLGIHLVLATQRPSGSVNDNILANTNLRISLRMLDPAESNAVLGTPDAAAIPVPLRGRAFARLGPRELVPFQSAYAGAPLVASAGESPIVVRTFATAGEGREVVMGGDPEAAAGGTHLDALLEAVSSAASALALPRARAPWREPLPDHVTLDGLLQAAGAAADRHVVIGLVDAPDEQEQYPALVDLEDGGGLLVFGSGGAGKTTTLRTIAASATAGTDPSEVTVFAVDFASRGLRSLEALPHVGAVATGDDLESVTRVVALLRQEIDRRRTLLSAVQAETLSAYRELGGDERLPRILLLVDGYPNLASAFTATTNGMSLEAWLDTFHHVVIDGRQVGVHTILTADRRGGVPSVVQSAIANRLVLRQADETGYGDHGISAARARSLDLAPGRGLWQGERLIQVACVSADGDGASQAAALAAGGAAARARGMAPAMRTASLPNGVDLVASIPASVAGPAVTIGIADLTLEPVAFDLAHSHLVVAGLPRSGRSTTAAMVASQLTSTGCEVWAIGSAGSPVAAASGLARAAFGRTDVLLPVLDELATLTESFPSPVPRVLVMDDLDALDDPSLSMLWERLVKADDLRVVATIETRNYAGFSMNAMLNEVRKARRTLFLQPDDAVELFQLTGVRPPIRPGTPMPPGRGVLYVDRRPVVVQVARAVTPATRHSEVTTR